MTSTTDPKYAPQILFELDPEEIEAVRLVRERRPLSFYMWTGAELVDLPPEPRARVRDGRIVCDDCDQPADTIHLVPWCVETEKVRAACPDHDPDGYWFRLDDLADDFDDWLIHLTEKTAGGGVVALLRWLDRRGLAVLRAHSGVMAG